MDRITAEIRDRSIDIGGEDEYHFDSLKPILKDKRFVFLGESGHCVKEYITAKISLIRFLHREMGFNVVAFESELGDCTIGDFFSSEYSAEEFMRGSIGKIWHNQFVLELFRELKESEGLHLTGIDVQQSRKKHFSSFLEKYLTGRIRQQYIDFDRLANELLDKNGIFKWRFRKTAEETAKMGKELIEGLEKQTFPSAMLHKVVMQTIENRLNYVKANFQKSFSKLFEYRDELMAKNLEFLSTHIYPADKFVIWAHNLHIKKQSSASRLSRYRSFAENLPPLMKEKSFVIGLYAKEGRMGDYSGRDYPIKKMSHKHMEWLLSHSPYQNSFVRCSHEWGQKKYRAFEGGGLRTSFVPARQYDGILFFKNVHPVTINEQVK